MALNFDQFAVEGNQFLNELAFKIGANADRDKAGRILKSVLHVLRNSLSIQENFQLMAQLPMCLKAVYVQNWKYSETPKRIRNLDQFAQELVDEDKKAGLVDFIDTEDAIYLSKSVIKQLRKYISEGELNDITANLKKDLKTLFEEEIFW